MTSSVEKKKAPKRYNDGEMITIQNSFKDNDNLIFALRRFMLQLPMTDKDEEIIGKVKANKPLLQVLRKTFLPTLDPEAPLQQLLDLWLTIPIADKTPEVALPHLVARETLINYLEQQLNNLEGKEISWGTVEFDSLIYTKGKDTNPAYTDLVARNTAIQHIEMMLAQLKILAEPEETPEQAVTRLRADSSK